MVIPSVQTRDVLKSRLDAVFAEDVFGAIYPGVQIPKMSLGYPLNEPPFYVAVDEVVDTATTSGAVSMGHAEVDFTLHVWAFAKHSDLTVAANTLQAYVDVIFASVLADQSFNYTVDNSFPSISGAGTAAESSKYYIAAATIDIACTVSSACPAEIMEVVAHANRS